MEESLDDIKVKWFVLTTINVFQPVKKDIIAQKLESRVERNRLDLVLDKLIAEKRIANDGGWFRLTSFGDKVMRGKLKVIRDIQRMKYLVNTSKRRGGLLLGDVSSPLIKDTH